MRRPVEELTKHEIENLIANHRRHGRTSEPLYIEALAEKAWRDGRGLNFPASLKAIRAAAKEKRYLSYKKLADASGAEWSHVRYNIGPHLWALVEYAHRHGWPMLSAVVVNKTNLANGEMEPETPKGFISAARGLGLTVTDAHAFLKDQQRLVFQWAESGPPCDEE